MSRGAAAARQRYARVREGFGAAMRWAPGERAAVVAALAEDDAEVAAEVASLLAHVVEEQREGAEAAGRGDRAAEPPARGAPWSLAQVLERMDELVAEVPAVRPPDSAGEAEGVREPDSAPQAGEEPRPLWTCATAAAVAPEELEPALGPRGPWSEVYALALVVRARLLGEQVAAGASVAALLRRARRDDAAPALDGLDELEVAPQVAAVLAAALSRRPATRIQSVARFRAQLAAAASEQGAAAREQRAAAREQRAAAREQGEPAQVARSWSARRRRRARAAAWLAVLVVLLAVAARYLWR